MDEARGREGDRDLQEGPSEGEPLSIWRSSSRPTPRTSAPAPTPQAERKAALGKAPVYMYRFQWYSPVTGGRLRAMHCMDIPFVFENVDACRTVVGDGPDRQPLADRMSAAWVAFARTGNPNHKGMPRWEPFTADRARDDDLQQRMPRGERSVSGRAARDRDGAPARRPSAGLRQAIRRPRRSAT